VRRHTWIWLGLIVVLGGLTAVAVGRHRVRASLEVRSAAITQGPIARSLLALGTLEPSTVVDVNSHVPGVVSSVFVDFNSPVRAGEVIAEVEPESGPSLPGRPPMPSVLPRRPSTRTAIRAPIDGIVIERRVDVGEAIDPSSEAASLFSIAADLTHMQLRAPVAEADLTQLVLFEPATFTVPDYPSRTFRGVFSQVRPGAVADAAAAFEPPPRPMGARGPSFTAVVEIGNPSGELEPGMTATVNLPGDFRNDTVRIPNSALTFSPPSDAPQRVDHAQQTFSDDQGDARVGTWRTVWTFDGTEFHAIAVETGLSDDEWTELIRGPLHAGDQLVTGANVAGHSEL
jgi:multidrug efflux pump subunit AcrA (membrane-fusion protein)